MSTIGGISPGQIARVHRVRHGRRARRDNGWRCRRDQVQSSCRCGVEAMVEGGESAIGERRRISVPARDRTRNAAAPGESGARGQADNPGAGDADSRRSGLHPHAAKYRKGLRNKKPCSGSRGCSRDLGKERPSPPRVRRSIRSADAQFRGDPLADIEESSRL